MACITGSVAAIGDALFSAGGAAVATDAGLAATNAALAAGIPESLIVTGAASGGLGALGTAALGAGALGAGLALGSGGAGAVAPAGGSAAGIGGLGHGWVSRLAQAENNLTGNIAPVSSSTPQNPLTDLSLNTEPPVPATAQDAATAALGGEQATVTAPAPVSDPSINPLITGAAAGAGAAALSSAAGLGGAMQQVLPDPSTLQSLAQSYGVPVATLLSGLLSAGGSLYGTSQAADAAKNALALQKQGLDQNQANFNTVQGNLKPFMTAGTNAENAYGSMLGLGNNITGTTPAGGIFAANGGGAVTDPNSDPRLQFLEQTPGYSFIRDQGLKSVQSANAAKGWAGADPTGAFTQGPGGKGLIDYSTGLAGTYFQNYLNSLWNPTALGQNAAAGFGNNAVGFSGNAITGSNNAGTAAQNIGTLTGTGTSNAFNQIGAGLIGGINAYANPLTGSNLNYPYQPAQAA